MSDLHVDSAPFELPEVPAKADVLIVACDIADGHAASAQWLRNRTSALGIPVLYVLGNHDYYANDLRDDAGGLYAEAGATLLHADPPMTVINGVRFVGMTLWTDYEISGNPEASLWWAKQIYPDVWNIDLDRRRLRPGDLRYTHSIHRNVLDQTLASEFHGPTVVITHHAPHPKSLTAERTGDSDGSYASDLSDLINRHRPSLWIHGHVHHSRDYVLGGPGDNGTRVVCNPRGYAKRRPNGASAENRGFDPKMVVDTSSEL